MANGPATPPLVGPDRAQSACRWRRRAGFSLELATVQTTTTIRPDIEACMQHLDMLGVVPYRVLADRGGVCLRAVRLRNQGSDAMSK